MSKKQRCTVLVGFVVVLLMGLFPPWLCTTVTPLDEPPWRVTVPPGKETPAHLHPGSITHEQHAGYRFLISSRQEYAGSAGGESWSITYYIPRRVDTSLLLVQWFLVAGITGITVMFLSSPTVSKTTEKSQR